jgi:hypothetical protein
MMATRESIESRLSKKMNDELAYIESNACAALESVGPDEMNHPAAIQQVMIRDVCRKLLGQRQAK